MKHKLAEIFAHFGDVPQAAKLVEEAQELSESVKENARGDIVEEMADVMVLLEQIKQAYSITDDEIQEVMEYKVARTLERIESGFYEGGFR